MALTAYAPHVVTGNSLFQQTNASNAPTVSAATMFTDCAFEYVYAPVAGSDTSFLRLSGRSATTGFPAQLAANKIYGRIDVGWDVFPDHEQFFFIEDTTGSVIMALRLNNGVITLHDVDDLLSATPTADGIVELTEGVGYSIFYSPDCSAGTCEIIIKRWSTQAMIDSFSPTGLNLGADVCGRVFTASGLSDAITGKTTYTNNPTPTYTARYGNHFIDSAAYPVPMRVGIRRPIAAGNYTGFAASAGQKLDCLLTDDGNTSYAVSTTANAAMTWQMQSFATAGIDAESIVAYCPYGVFWDIGGSVTIGTRWRSGGSDYNMPTPGDPGAVVQIHARGITHLLDPLTGLAWTREVIEASETGCFRDAGTVEVRVGSLADLVIYVPAVAAGGVPGLLSRGRGLALPRFHGSFAVR